MLEGIDISHWETVTDWPAKSRAGFATAPCSLGHTRQGTEDFYA
jgi:GH25 family lysozyme M1 (1,4-beta-N-acetylmuramidase)